MLGNKVVYVFSEVGALSANIVGRFILDKPATLMHVSFGCTCTGNAATLALGDSGDPNGILEAGAIGQTNVPAEFRPADFDGDLCDELSGYHFPVGDLSCLFTITHNSAEDVCLVLTFYEG